MAKRSYIKVRHQGRQYKLYMDDVKNTHKHTLRKTPALPAYDEKK